MINYPQVQPNPVMAGMAQSQALIKSVMDNLTQQKTMQDQIAATNAQNQAVSQTAMPNALAGLAQNQAAAQFAVPTDQAKLNLMRAQAQNLLTPDFKVTPYNNFNQLYTAWVAAPQGSPQKYGLGQMLDNLTAGKGGLSIQQGPNGLTVTQGMALPSQNGGNQNSFAALSGAQPQQTQGANPNNPQQGDGSLEMMPTGLGTNSRFSNGGQVFASDQGDKLITDDRTQQARDQLQLAGIQRAIPQLQELVSVANQTQGAVPSAQAKVGGLLNSLTQNTPFALDFQLPSLQADKEMRANNIAEGLIKTYGVNATNHTLDIFRNNVQPQQGESTLGYARRMIGQTADLMGMSAQTKSRLVNGTTIDKNGNIVLPDWAASYGNNTNQQSGGSSQPSGSNSALPSQNDIAAEIARRQQNGTWK